MMTDFDLMMKCDMCYDRTSTGLKPMCATVCPSQALFYGTLEEIERLRPQSAPINTFQFGAQTIATNVFAMVPRATALSEPRLDVTAELDAEPPARSVRLKVVAVPDDPFAEVEI